MARIFRALLIAAVNAIQEFFAFATKECLEEGLANITNNGCTDLGDGLYQGGNGKSLEMSDILPITNANSWEFQTRYTYKSSASQCTLLGYVDPASNDYKTPWIFIQSNRMYLRINNMSVWQSTFILEIDKTYDIKVGFTGTAYYIDAKLDTDENYTNYLTQSSTTKQNNTAPIMLMDFGYRTNTNQYYNNGIIDMTRTKFIIDGVTTYFWSEILNVGDNIKLNDGMATSNYDWSAYPSNTTTNGTYTQTGTIESIKQINNEVVYVTAEPVQDNKDATINTGKIYYAYTNENDNTDSVYTIDNPIQGGKQKNYNTVGSSINDTAGIISGFGTSQKQYIISTNKFNFTADTWSIITKIKFYSAKNSWFLGSGFVGSESKFSILLGTDSSNHLSALLSSGSGWNISGTTSSKTFNLNEYYYIKYYFTGTSYKVDLSTTGEFSGEEENFIDVSSSTKVYNADNYIMFGANPYGGSASQNLDGEIDANYTGFICNNVETKFLSDVPYSTLYENTGTIEFTPVALDPQPEFTIQNAGLINAEVVGTLTNNNGVYSGFSNSNYIVLNKKYTETPYSFIVSLKTGASLNRIEILSNWSNYFFYIRENYLSFFDGNSRNSGSTQLSTNTKYWLAFSCDGTTTKTYYAVNDDTYNISNLPAFSDLTFWSENSTFTGNLLLNKTLYLGASNAGNAAGSSIDLNNIELKYGNIINTDFYDPKSGIEIGNDLYERNSSADDILGITANIETVDNTTINSVTVSTPTQGYEDVKYYAYTNENDNADTLYATDNPASKGIFNLQNATKQGDVKVDANGIISDISSSNYVQITPFSAYTTSFEFVAKVKLSSSSSSAIIGNGNDNYSGGGFVLRTYSGTRLLLWGIYNYSNWDVGAFNTGIDLPTNGDWIWVKMTWDGSKYEFWKSSNGTDYGTRTAYLDSTTPFCVPYVSKIGASGNTSFYFKGNIDLSETYYIVDGNKTTFGYFSDPSTLYENTGTIEFTPIALDPQPAFEISNNNIVISDTLYERNINKDNFTRETVPATIQTSANITTSNNDNVVSGTDWHLFNLTAPQDMTTYIQSSGIEFTPLNMPLLLKNNVGVGLLLKNGNNVYYRNSWIINRDYDLHFQEIRFATNVQNPTITLKINNVLTSAPYYTYAGDKIEYIISKEGYCDYSSSFITSYTSKDGKITTINAELVASNGTVDVSNYEYTLDNQGNMILTKYKGDTDTVVPNI